MMLPAPFQPATVDAEDPFCHGERWQKVVLPDGTERSELVPLTLEDWLHPQEEDRFNVSDDHEIDLRYLYNSLKWAARSRPDAYVLGNVNVRWDHPALPHANRPDITVVFGVRERRNWSTFDCRVEQATPILVVEIASPSNWKEELTRKLPEYHLAGVRWHLLVDRVNRRPDGNPVLTLRQHTPAGYVIVPPDAQGRYAIPELGVTIGVAHGWTICYDASGEVILDFGAQIDARLAAERQAAEAERQVAEAERQVAEAERQAAEAVRRAAAAEHQMAAAARRLAELERREAEARARAEAEARARAAAEREREALRREVERLRQTGRTDTDPG